MARPLEPGDEVPDFHAPDAQDRTWTRRGLLGRPYVLYFYPADDTPGCTTQACALRDAWDDFQTLGLAIFGVSRDSPESHRRFAATKRLPFTLLSDGDGRMHRAFGATMLGGLARRVSYLVDAEGRVAAVYDSHLRPGAHAEKMLEAARRLLAGE